VNKLPSCRLECRTPLGIVHDDDEVIKSNKKLWDDLGFEHVGTVVPCSKDRPDLYTGDTRRAASLAEGIDPSQISLKGVFVDHCQYLGVYIGCRLEHPSVWFRSPF